MNHNGRPLTMRKKVQLLLGLTILAWATQTLFAQWSRGAETSAQPAARGGTLELRAEARVFGAEVKLKQVCRWSDADAATFAPLADVVIARLDARRPFKVVGVQDVRQTLEEAGVNVAMVRFAGPVECTISRSDAELSEGEALEQWIAATGEKKTGEKKVSDDQSAPAPAEPQAAAVEPEQPGPKRTLRAALVAEMSLRLAIPQEQIVLSMDPKDDGALNMSEPQFKFGIQPRRGRDLGDVAWDVTVTSTGGGGSRKLQLRGTARAWQQQAVVAKPLGRGQVIQESDLLARRTLVDKTPDAALLKPDQIVGQAAARDLKPGTVVTAPLVEALPLAKPGQFIAVTLERGGIRVKSVAKALEGGTFGETIRVKNESTKDVYQVVLTGPQQATMAPAAASVEDKGVASVPLNE